MKRIKIGTRYVGDGEPCFIIAEAGVNHNGDVTLAKKLIDIAYDSGADAVKFQTFRAEDIVTKTAEKAKYQKKATNSSESQYEMIKKLELTRNDFKDLADYALKKGIVFLSSPFDKDSVDLLDDIGVTAYKVASGEITNFPLLTYIAKKGKPIILSTGMATLGEIDDAIKHIVNQDNTNIVLLHCITNYPAKIETSNLRVIQTLNCTFKVPVGFSDHTIGINASVAAVALGARIIEKHFTVDKFLSGPDHKASLEPQKLKEMIKAIRDIELALGNGIKRPIKEEQEIKKIVSRSIVARVVIPVGTIITQDMLTVKRPGVGISPKHIDLIIGRKAKKSIDNDELIAWDMVE